MSDQLKGGCAFLVIVGIASSVISAVVKSCSEDSSRNSIPQHVAMVEAKWFEGGTLNNNTVLQWKHASERNKLATCAGWISTWVEHERSVEKYRTMDDVKGAAELLRGAIDFAVSDPRTKDTESITNIAVLVGLALKLAK